MVALIGAGRQAGRQAPGPVAVQQMAAQEAAAAACVDVQQRGGAAACAQLHHRVCPHPPQQAARLPLPAACCPQDVVRGEVSWNTDTLGDFVLLRSNGLPVYNFCVAIDDALMRITHVIRAEEHLPNTLRQVGGWAGVGPEWAGWAAWLCGSGTVCLVDAARRSCWRLACMQSSQHCMHRWMHTPPMPQVLIYQALGFAKPVFGHVSLILAPDKSKLSKRHGATSVGEFREDGFLAAAMLNYLSLLGWNDGSEQEIYSVEQLQQAFSLERITKSAAGEWAQHSAARGVRLQASMVWVRFRTGAKKVTVAGLRQSARLLADFARASCPVPPLPCLRPCAVFDKTKLSWMNGQHLRALPEAEMQAMVGERWVASGLLARAESPFAAAALAIVQSSLELVAGAFVRLCACMPVCPPVKDSLLTGLFLW